MIKAWPCPCLFQREDKQRTELCVSELKLTIYSVKIMVSGIYFVKVRQHIDSKRRLHPAILLIPSPTVGSILSFLGIYSLR